uniref:Uncharacterized protein n=1 Tax=Schistosoma mansoni TaxID=6183 RepID=A0A5K4F6T4_SCHMA
MVTMYLFNKPTRTFTMLSSHWKAYSNVSDEFTLPYSYKCYDACSSNENSAELTYNIMVF